MLDLLPADPNSDRATEVAAGREGASLFAELMATHAPARFAEADVYGIDAEVAPAQPALGRTIPLSVLAESLADLVARRSLDDVLLALLAVYLYRTSCETDQCIPVIGPETGGPVPAVRPLFVRVPPAATFAEVVDMVRAERLGSLGFEPVPLSASGRGKAEDWNRPLPLAVVIGEDEQAVSASAARVRLHLRSGCSDVRLVFPEARTAAFGDAVAEHLQGLAAAIAARPDVQVGRHVYLSEAERRRILVEWNETDVDYGHIGGLVDQLEQQAAMQPDHPAVTFRGHSLSYGEFNAQVNRLARFLRKSNVGKDTFVAICLERSVEMVVAIWAILKAGGAYVPLNVEDPPQRLASIIRNAGARVILTEEKFVRKLPKTKTTIVLLSPEAEAISEESPDDLGMPIDPRSLAYMIYTSGSTGEPKGVLIEHVAIWNRIAWMQDAYRLTPEDRVMQKTPYTFDVSVWEFLWPLTVGATLVVAEPGGHVVPSYLARLMRQERITCVHFVPSVLRLFLTCPALHDLALRMVFCSGEALSHELQEQFFARIDAGLHNLYGPTEAAVDVTFWDCDRSKHRGRVPIGRPIANIRMHILDELLEPVPPGVPGDLYIGGIGLARGYWQRPELTAERFIDHPLGISRPGKLYLTGDIARYLPDGNIEYLGRNDHQVKVNGIRIELGEIESVIRLHPAVQDAAVITQKSDSGNAQLLAYMVPKAQGKGSAALDHLREFLEKRLPPHMIPRQLNHVSRIPLTVSGKVDRKALAQLRAAA